VNVYVVEVAPATSVHVAPPLVLTCHRTVGVGLPVALAENVTGAPIEAVWFDGLVVIVGALNRGAVPVPETPMVLAPLVALQVTVAKPL